MRNLKKHKKVKHEGIRYPCDQCEDTFSYIYTLKQHKEAKHEMLRYSCDQCIITFSRISDMKKHKEVKHGHVQDPEFIEVPEMNEEYKEIKTELDIDPISIINYDDSENNTTMVEINKGNAMNKDCEAKIEPDIDLVVKTEPSDISELID